MSQELKTHIILRSYIALARCESFEPKAWTLAGALADAQGTDDWKCYSQIEWINDKKLSAAIRKARGLDYSEQFKLGIVRVPGKMLNLLISDALVKRHGLPEVSAVAEFDEKGLLKIPSRKDFIFPIKTNGLISRFTFYTIPEMEKWRSKAA